jgi:hypothetical protein
MKELKVILLGIAIWSLSLLWPEVNQLLSPLATIVLMVVIGTTGLGIIALIYVLEQKSGQEQDDLYGETGYDFHSRVTRPMPAFVTGNDPASEPTRPLVVIRGQDHPSRPTRPVGV